MGDRATGGMGRKKTRKVHDPETCAAAMSALLAGQGVAQVAREYQIPRSTVSRWKKEARQRAGRSDDIGALLLDYLREALLTLRVQAGLFRDKSWIHEQCASDAAILHGVVCDKVTRLLEALDDGGERDNG